MSILTRFGDIIASNVNALLDKAEDPSKMIDQYLRNAKEDLADVKQETAVVMAEENRCKRLVDDAQADVTKYTNLAKKALTAGNEEDARVFLAEKQSCEARLATAQNTYAVAKANADKMRQLYDKLTSDVAALEARRQNVKATVAVAKTQQRINDAAAAVNGTRGSISAFARMEEKANDMLDRANAEAALNEMPENPAAALEAKYGSSANPSSVDDELAALKAELGL